MGTHICCRCELPKPLSEFYPDRRKLCGIDSRCKACQSKRTKDQAYRRDPSKRKPAGGSPRERHSDEETRRRYLDSLLRAKARNRKREATCNAVYRAVLAGKLMRLPCQECGQSPSEAHHPDYDKPLDVLWLCRKHHRAWHSINGPGKNRD